MKPTRRHVVLAGGAGLLTALSGCQGLLGSDTPSLDFIFINYTDEPQPLQLEVLEPGGSEYQSALAFEGDFEVPPSEFGPDTTEQFVTAQDTIESQPCLIRVRLKFGNGQWEHTHFYPGEEGTGGSSGRYHIQIMEHETTGVPYVVFAP